MDDTQSAPAIRVRKIVLRCPPVPTDQDGAISQEQDSSTIDGTQIEESSSENYAAPSVKRVKLSHTPRPQTPAVIQSVSFSEKPAAVQERKGKIQFRVVNNDGNRENLILLTGAKCLFQRQLPEMPSDYVARIVYDRTHLSLVLTKMPRMKVVGGITFREFRDRGFAEIVFCAISSEEQVRGYGSLLMAHLKDYVRATSPVMHFLTYADNFALGYFQKQGFSKEISLDKTLWMGVVKDYEGGTFMHCPMLPRIRYLKADQMLLEQKEALLVKCRASDKSYIIHPSPKAWASGRISPLNPFSIHAIRDSGWSPAMDKLARDASRASDLIKMRRFLSQIQDHSQAWPFLAPVREDQVPGYHKVITSPMDLSTVEAKLESGSYPTLKDLILDLKLMFANCRRFNAAYTVYYKCAVNLERFMRTLSRE